MDKTMQTINELPALVRPKDAARVTGLCPKTLARMMDEGRLRGIRVHQHRRYNRESLRALVSGDRQLQPGA